MKALVTGASGFVGGYLVSRLVAGGAEVLGLDAIVMKINDGSASGEASGSFEIDVVATRSFSHTGPGQTTTFVLPSFAMQCAEIKAGLREPVLRTGNLEVTRDFLDVRDVVEAYILLAENGKSGMTYNVCSGSGLVLTDAVEHLTALTGTDVRVEPDPQLFRPADIPVLTGDNGRLIEDCGWSAVTGRGKMLDDLFMWWEASVKAALNG